MEITLSTIFFGVVLYILPLVALISAGGLCIFKPALARTKIGISRTADGFALAVASVIPLINIIVVLMYLHYKTFK